MGTGPSLWHTACLCSCFFKSNVRRSDRKVGRACQDEVSVWLLRRINRPLLEKHLREVRWGAGC